MSMHVLSVTIIYAIVPTAKAIVIVKVYHYIEQIMSFNTLHTKLFIISI